MKFVAAVLFVAFIAIASAGVTDMAKNAYQASVDTAKGAYQTSMDKASNMTSSVTGTVKGVVDKMVGPAVEAVKELGDVAKIVTEALLTVKDVTKSVVSSMKTVGSVGDDVASRLKSLAESTRKMTEKFTNATSFAMDPLQNGLDKGTSFVKTTFG